VTEALYTLHRSGSVIMLIYEKVRETTAHLPSNRPIKNRHLEVTIWSSMKNVIFTSPISLYSWVPILACACICCVINEKSKFYTKIAQKTEKKETSQIEHPVFRIFAWQFAVHNICKPPYCHMVSVLNSLYNAVNIVWLKSSRISYFYKNVELTLSYNDQ
jgi:hypothetical protein